MSAPRAAYVHVPFCVHRCGYCDFTVVAGRDDLIEPFLDALETEIRGTLTGPTPVSTLFLGGGTPTYLPPPALARLLGILRQWLPLAPGGEFSIEANPAGFDAERIALLMAAGVNRVSLGAQSFDRAHLRTLERDHHPRDVSQVVDELRRQGCDNISLDLIYAIPGQGLLEWEQTLAQALSLGPPHLSVYGLTWEKGTTFWSRRLRGILKPSEEELERAMYAAAMNRLPAAGLEQYELSNFARPGWECRHNQVYWRAESYYGFGPGAASFLDGVRRTNHRSTTTWVRRIQQGHSAVGEEERLSEELRAREAVMLGLRQTAGIELAQFERCYGRSVESLAPAAYGRFQEQGLTAISAGRGTAGRGTAGRGTAGRETAGRLFLTEQGRFLADMVMSEFL